MKPRDIRPWLLLAIVASCDREAPVATPEPIAALAPSTTITTTTPEPPPVRSSDAHGTPLPAGPELAVPPPGPQIVPQIVHRSAPLAVFASRGRALVWSADRSSIVELDGGVVRAWAPHFREQATPRAAEFAEDGSYLRLAEGEYADPYEDELVVVGPDGEHEASVPEGTVATFVSGGVAAASTELHLYDASLASDRIVDLEWRGRADRIVAAPDGHLVAVENEAGDLRVVSVESAAIVLRLHAEPWPRLARLRAEEAAARDDDEEEADEEETDEPPPGELSAHGMWLALVLSSEVFAAVRADGLVRVLDPATSHALAALPASPELPDVSSVGLSADGHTLVLFRETEARAIDVRTGAPVLPVPEVSGRWPAPAPETADLLTGARGGEHSIWHARHVPVLDGFLLAGRFGGAVVGTGGARAIDCLDGENLADLLPGTTLVPHGWGLCDVASGHGFDPDDVAEELAYDAPDVAIVRGALGVLSGDGTRQRIPGTEGASVAQAHLVTASHERLLLVDDGASARVFSVDRDAGLLVTLASAERPYARVEGALLVSGPAAWRAVAVPDGHELARVPTSQALEPRACVGADGTIAIGLEDTLYVFDGDWQAGPSHPIPGVADACVVRGHILDARGSRLDVYRLDDAARVASWNVGDAQLALSVGRAVHVRDGSVLDVYDLVDGAHLLAFGFASSSPLFEQAEISDDGRFYTVPDGVTARIARLSDGACVRIGVVHRGGARLPYAIADDGAFWAPSVTLPHIRVREAGPAFAAPMLSVEEATERFSRPTLLDDFLRDRPLPRADGSPVAPE